MKNEVVLMNNNYEELKIGIVYTAGAYISWGVLPLYWKLLKEVPAFEILAHRVLWSFIFMIIIVSLLKKWPHLKNETNTIIRDWRKLTIIVAASVLISINWFAYIWAVNSNHILDASLGYYINPLVSVILGIIVLKERLNIWQVIAFLLAMIGVANQTIAFGSVPWVAIILALSFGLYGLLKKLVPLGTLLGLTIETLIVSPIALFYIMNLQITQTGAFNLSLIGYLLIGGGIMTAIPLMLFASGAKRIPLSMVGFLQYLAPTIMLILGVFLFDETFTPVHFISFSFIWLALTIYSFSRTKLFLYFERKLIRKAKSVTN